MRTLLKFFIAKSTFAANQVNLRRMSALQSMDSMFGEGQVYPLITDNEPACRAIGFKQLGVAVSDISLSVNFYSKIGFSLKKPGPIPVLENRGGLELHLFQSDCAIEDGKNILMDFPLNKYPGHTHASFRVPSVVGAQTFLESQDMVISGDRKRGDTLYAVFVRDPDRTTLEFERNDGKAEDIVVTGDMIGYPQRIDHVGIRVSDPPNRFQFYADKLGFVQDVGKYELNPDPLKNGRPWISRTLTNCDINFIPNCNEVPPENALIAGGRVRPGIVYVSFTVDDVATAEVKLKAAGVVVYRDSELVSSPWSCLVGKVNEAPDGQSIFLQDDDMNILRLVSF